MQTLSTMWLSSEGVWVFELTRAADAASGPPRLSPSSWVDLCLEMGPKGQGRHVGTAAVQHPMDGFGLWEAWFPGATWIQAGVGWVTEQL